MDDVQNPIKDSLELSFKMLSKIGELFNSFNPEFVDLSKLIAYEEKFNRAETVRGEDLEILGMETLRAMDLATDYHYIATRFAKFSHLQYDRKSAHIYFMDAPKFLAASSVKDSHSAREKYADQHVDFLEYKNTRDSWQALCDWLDRKREIFREKHMWIKKTIDQIINKH